jgi:hypothetical protein
MHPYMAEAMAKVRADDLYREAAFQRVARPVTRPRYRTRWDPRSLMKTRSRAPTRENPCIEC